MKSFTLLMTARNRAAQLGQALYTIIGANECHRRRTKYVKYGKALNIVVINDASTDNTAEILDPYIGSNFRVYRLMRSGKYQKNPGGVLNIGHTKINTELAIEQCGEVCHLTDCITPLIENSRPGRVCFAHVYAGAVDQMRLMQELIADNKYEYASDYVTKDCPQFPGMALRIMQYARTGIKIYCGIERPAPLFFLGAIHEEDFQMVGGYNEDLAAGADDDFASRLHRHGFEFYFSGQAVAFHLKHGKT